MSRIARRFVPFALAALALAGPAAAEEPAPEAAPPAQQPPPHVQQMQQQRRAFMEQLQERNKRLDDLVAKMNAAQGEAKVDAIAAVINEMVEQRRAMQPHPGMGGPLGMGGPMGGAPPPAPPGGAKPPAR
jgi:hypothetical protein